MRTGAARSLLVWILILGFTWGAGLVPAARGQQVDLVLRINNDLTNMDPAQIATSWDYALAYVVYSSLVRQNPGSSEIVPDLATRWETSPDGLVYTFHLRRGVKWHKGFGDFTAEDVKYSFERIMNPAGGSRFFADFEAVRSVEAVDPYTVRITLKSPRPAFLSAVLAYRPGYIVNRRALERFGRQYTFNVVGTGPYVFDEYVPGQGVIVSVNKDFYGSAPEVPRAMFRIIKDDAVVEIAAQKGDVHVAYVQKSAVLARLAKDTRVMSKIAPLPRVVWVLFNQTRAPFADLRVRRAMSYAVDKAAIVRSVYLGQAKPAGTVLSPGMFGYVDEERYPVDLDKAKELLAEAGFPGGIKGKTFDMIVSAGSDIELTAAVLQQQWKKIGIDVKVTALDDSLWQARRRALQFDLFGDGALRLEPDQILGSWFHSSQIPVPNASSYRGADALIEGAQEQMDSGKRREWLIAAQRRIQADAPVIPLLNPNVMLVWRPGVRGAEVGPLTYKLEALSVRK